MSRLPYWLHPWRWYAATVIVEALYRHVILRETARAIGARCGRGDRQEWRKRWRAQLLVSPTLWGWLGSRLGIRKAAETRQQGQAHLTRWLGEMRLEPFGSGWVHLYELWPAAAKTALLASDAAARLSELIRLLQPELGPLAPVR